MCKLHLLFSPPILRLACLNFTLVYLAHSFRSTHNNEALSEYILALVRITRPTKTAKMELQAELLEFLKQETPNFLNKLFDRLANFRNVKAKKAPVQATPGVAQGDSETAPKKLKRKRVKRKAKPNESTGVDPSGQQESIPKPVDANSSAQPEMVSKLSGPK